MKTIKSILALGMVGVLLMGSAVASADVDYKTGTPWLDPELPGNVTEETSVNIKDNFALAVNYDSYLIGTIPEGRPYGGTVSNARINVDEEMNQMLQSIDPASTHDAELCVNYYNLLLDWDTRNKLGIAPILPTIESIKAMDSIDAVSDYLTDTDPVEVCILPISVGVDGDPNDATAVALKIGSACLHLGDSDYCLKESDIGTRTKTATAKLMKNMLLKVGFSAEEAAALDTFLDVEFGYKSEAFDSEWHYKQDALSRGDALLSIALFRQLSRLFSAKFPNLTALIDGYPTRLHRFVIGEPNPKVKIDHANRNIYGTLL